jgi:dihydroxyacetone kinase DhaKLM complex PTS-EIIA-like component DhaM
MKVNFNRGLSGTKGERLGRTAYEVVRDILFSANSNERMVLNVDEKYSSYKLHSRLLESEGEIELSVEEATLIKKICSDALVSGAYGQLCDLIEGRNDTAKK